LLRSARKSDTSVPSSIDFSKSDQKKRDANDENLERECTAWRRYTYAPLSRVLTLYCMYASHSSSLARIASDKRDWERSNLPSLV
jgi:hypothetical protein